MNIKERLAELDEANRRMEAETEKIISKTRAFKAANGGFSRAQLAPRRPDQFCNSNVSGGGL